MENAQSLSLCQLPSTVITIKMPHPLQQLSLKETEIARDALLNEHSKELVVLRNIFLQESPKDQVVAFLDLEHAGKVTESTERPARLAKCQYDLIGGDKIPSFHEATVDVRNNKIVHHEIIGKEHHAPLTL